ncbi:MAG: ATP-binding protein [Thermoanaerobaculia bacterium]
MGASSRQARDHSRKGDVARFPTWLCGITLALTFVTFALVAWAAYGKYRTAESFRNRESRIGALHGIILRLDEVLTMSARMAAATGDLRWEQRYRRYDPQLDAAIAEAKALVPGGSSIAAIAGTDAANVKLVAMENRAFALVRAGHLNEAHAVLSSPAYETQKVLYSTGLDEVLKEQRKRLDGNLAKAKQRATFSLAASGALLLFSIATWIVIFGRLRGMQGELERRITGRTAELSAANVELLEARDEAQRIADINAQLSRQSALILNTVADGIMGMDLKGNLTFLNSAASRIIGRTQSDFENSAIHDVIHSKHADGSPYPAEDCAMVKAIRHGQDIEMAVDTFWRSDGSSFPVEFSATTMRDERGRFLGAVIAFRDIGERRAIEKMKDEFVSTVSHELRTPLTSIRGALGLLNSGMLGTEKGQRMLQIAVTNTDRLVRLINDILDLERIGSGKIELTRTDVDAGALMTQAVEGVQSMADEAGVSLAAEQIRATLWIDSDRIMRTLTNLLSNAIKFSPRGTTVTLSGSPADANFTFRVADQGRGVPADKLDTIFERFQQVDASDSRDKGGSGLGLAICRSIVNAHHGRIWAERNEGGGSVFQFSIPIQRSAPAAEPADLLKPRTLLVSGGQTPSLDAPDTGQTSGIPIIVATAPSQESFESHAAGIASSVRKPFETADLMHAVDVACASPAILIVEDDVDLARVMTASLQSRGIRTLHATTGQEALHLCTQHQPILIVLDLALPDIDGFAVVRSLRGQKTLGRTPLLVYSATEVGSVDQARLELGPTEFLTKSRGSLQDFTSQVVRMLNTVTVPTEETEHAA